MGKIMKPYTIPTGLRIDKLSENAYVHISYLETKQFGRVACNGAVFLDNKQAVVLETPISDKVSRDLITWIKEELETEIIAVIAHHYHIDCVGGLEAFHEQNIPFICDRGDYRISGEGQSHTSSECNEIRSENGHWRLGNQQYFSRARSYSRQYRDLFPTRRNPIWRLSCKINGKF